MDLLERESWRDQDLSRVLGIILLNKNFSQNEAITQVFNNSIDDCIAYNTVIGELAAPQSPTQ